MGLSVYSREIFAPFALEFLQHFGNQEVYGAGNDRQETRSRVRLTTRDENDDVST